MSIKFRTGVVSDSNKTHQFEESNVKSKMQSVCCATSEMLIKADDVLEGLVYDCLSEELKEMSLHNLNQKFGLKLIMEP